MDAYFVGVAVVAPPGSVDASLRSQRHARAGQPRARQTTAVTTPFAVRWCLVWKAITDALVLGPKSPSTTGPASAFCSTLTVAFRSPSPSVTFSYAAYRPAGTGSGVARCGLGGAQRAPYGRGDDPVGGQLVGGLEGDDRAPGAGAEVPVDQRQVQGLLQHRDGGAGGADPEHGVLVGVVRTATGRGRDRGGGLEQRAPGLGAHHAVAEQAVGPWKALTADTVMSLKLPPAVAPTAVWTALTAGPVAPRCRVMPE